MPEGYVSEYDEMYAALCQAAVDGQCIIVDLEGKHFGSVAAAVRKRLKEDKPRKDVNYISCSKNDDGTITLVLGTNKS